MAFNLKLEPGKDKAARTKLEAAGTRAALLTQAEALAELLDPRKDDAAQNRAG